MLADPRTFAPRLQRGDRVAVVSPAAATTEVSVARSQRAVVALQREFGLHAVAMPHVLATGDDSAVSARDRAQDVNEAFTDPTLRGIICSMEGSDSVEVLELLDWGEIRKNPKVFYGSSNVTSLHHALSVEAGLVTLYGPTVFARLSSAQSVSPVAGDWFRRTAMTVDSPRVWDPAEPHRVLRHGFGEGITLAAGSESADAIIGTHWQPEYGGAVLLLESVVGSDLEGWQANVTDLRDAGLLDNLAALLVAKSSELTADQVTEQHAFATAIVRDWDYPVVADVGFGGANPAVTLPLGVRARVSNAEIIMLESAVR